MRAAVLSLMLLGVLAGCAGGGSFPSLAPRPAERALAEEPTRAPMPAIADDPALAARLSELVARARGGGAAFDAAIVEAQAAVAGAGAAGSEGWIAAQVAVSRVEATRVPTTIALAELDALRVGRAQQATSAGDLSAIAAAIDQVQGLADAQSSRLEQLRAGLSPL